VIALVLGVALAGDPTPSGWRIGAVGGASGVRVGQEFVVGSTGGTNATTLEARVVGPEGGNVTVAVPFSAFRTPEGREIGIGNIRLGVYNHVGHGKLAQSMGVELHFHAGSAAWTWTDHAEDLWPGEGVALAWQGRLEAGETSLLFRAALGVNGARGYEPYPAVFGQVQAAMGFDRPIAGKFGVTGEGVITYWDLSPFEVTALARLDPIDGMRIRGGFVLPMAVWVGATPSDQAAGLSETTLLLDVTLHL
jgi:hypothetical protein